MRAFAFGLIVGACACFAVLRIFDPPLARQAQGEQLPVRSTQPGAPEPNKPPSCPNVATVTVAQSKQLEPKATAAPSAERDNVNSQPVSSGQFTAVQKPVLQERLSLEDLSDKEAAELCELAQKLRYQRERAAKAAEPKDAGWAYSMEQLIRQHIESHVPSDQYTKLQLECRTTFCELRMEGNTGKEGLALLDKAANDIANQPWSDIARKGGGSGLNGDEWHAEYEWYRPATESERRMWLRQRN